MGPRTECCIQHYGDGEVIFERTVRRIRFVLFRIASLITYAHLS